ncbi:hypothetical protein LTS18_004520, partial [Coniosporium uncinatum]
MANSATEADINAWNMQTEQACMGSLMNLKGLASNQAGMAVCYNLPFLDPATGVFEAELRMFNVSPPINEWVGVAPQDIMVTLSYLGATVQKANGALQRRAVDDLSKLVERQTTMPQQLKVLTYVGQINSNLRGSQMNLPQLQPLLIPQIDLTANNRATNTAVNTTLSSTEASFVNGVFAQKGTTTVGPQAAASASAAVAAATPFVLPGVTLGIFPVGLIITCIWTFFFLLVVGLGTIGRIQFKEQYERRMRREQANN